MIELEVLDSNGVKLQIGDNVRVVCRYIKDFVYYTTFTVVDGCLFPHDAFSSPVITKINSIPSGAKEIYDIVGSDRPVVYVLNEHADFNEEDMPSLKLLMMVRYKSMNIKHCIDADKESCTNEE